MSKYTIYFNGLYLLDDPDEKNSLKKTLYRDGFSLVFDDGHLTKLLAGPFEVGREDVFEVTNEVVNENVWYISGIDCEFDEDDDMRSIYSVYDRYVTSVAPEFGRVYRNYDAEGLFRDVVSDLYLDVFDRCETCVITEFIKAMENGVCDPASPAVKRYVFEYLWNAIDALDER